MASAIENEFNSDTYKKALELLFNNHVHEVQLQQHLGLFLEPKVSFNDHIQRILNKTCQIID